MVVVKNCEQLKEQILAFNKEIKIVALNATQLFKNTCEKYPIIAVYVNQSKLLTSLTGVTLSLTYNNCDIKPACVSLVKNTQEFEQSIHESISKYRLKSAVIVESGVNYEGVLGNFLTEYSGFYSNLVDMDYHIYSSPLTRGIIVVFSFTYRIGSVMLGIMERAVDEEVARLVKRLFCSGMSDGVKAYIAHNYLAKTVEYYNREDATSLERSYMQSAYGALINKKCVCQGYAEAYKRILNEVGIDCAVICGKIKGSLEHHAWNAVILEGESYHVDVTWDSLGDGFKNEEYFCKSDKFFIKDRLWQRNLKYTCACEENILGKIKADIILNAKKYKSLGADARYFN